MANKKQLIQKTDPSVTIENEYTIPVEDSNFKEIYKDLKKIRTIKGVLGYIMRNGVSAEIDLQEPEKLVEYAMFTSQVLDSSKELVKIFELGNSETILVECNDVKVLNMLIEEIKIHVFMKNNVDHEKIAKKLLS